MKQILSLVMIAVMAITAATIVSCSKDNSGKENVDTTLLREAISTGRNALSLATTDNYPQDAINAFKAVVDAADKALNAGSIDTQAKCDNLTTQIKKALEEFEQKAYDAIPNDALIMALGFDEGEGTSLKTAGSNEWTATLQKGPADIFGTNTAIPTFVDGKSGKAMHFTSGSHLEIADYAAAKLEGNALSIAVWVKPDKVFANNYIISYNYWNTWKLQVQDGSKPFFTVSTANGISDMDNETDNSVPTNTWTHIVVAGDFVSGTVVFYVNGKATKTWNSENKGDALKGGIKNVNANKVPLCIGACTTIDEAKTWSWFSTEISGWGCFYGSIDELKVYNIALTSGQVGKLYGSY